MMQLFQTNIANNWTITLFNLLADGYSLEAACANLATDSTYIAGELNQYMICGNKSFVLQ